MSPKVLKATTVEVNATVQPITLPVITQNELYAYQTMTQQAEISRKQVRLWEKRCEQFLTLVTGLSKDKYTKLSPNELSDLLDTRLGTAFQLEEGPWDFVIDTKTERGIVSWKQEVIKLAGEAHAAQLKANAPKSYSHRFVATKQ